MTRCDNCGRLVFRARVKSASLRFCSEKCRGERVWTDFIHRQHGLSSETATPKPPALTCCECAGIGTELFQCDGKILCVTCATRWHESAFPREWFEAVERKRVE